MPLRLGPAADPADTRHIRSGYILPRTRRARPGCGAVSRGWNRRTLTAELANRPLRPIGGQDPLWRSHPDLCAGASSMYSRPLTWILGLAGTALGFLASITFCEISSVEYSDKATAEV